MSDEGDHQDVEPSEPESGDEACWLDRVCEQCGGLGDGPRQSRCPRCGADLPDATDLARWCRDPASGGAGMLVAPGTHRRVGEWRP
jgi:hypothetical protein